MKKIILGLLLISFQGYSQLSGGIKSGALLSNFKFENSESEKSGLKPSFYAGIFIEYKFKRVAPEFEVSYNQSGNRGSILIRQNFDDVPTKLYSNYKLNLLMFSVASKFYLTKKFNLKFGVHYSQVLYVENSIENFPGINGALKTDLTDSWKKNDFGVLFGVNFDITKHLFLDGTYLIGLSDLREIPKYEVNNRMIKIGAGYKF
ncbi:porin family protein [Flavobacterium sp.]|uniref:porin family protein n=1 Tax=Flavobacterium sp. TaxID=239 RepID=UPI003753126F